MNHVQKTEPRRSRVHEFFRDGATVLNHHARGKGVTGWIARTFDTIAQITRPHEPRRGSLKPPHDDYDYL